MKLGKNEIQKIFLGGLLLIGLLYCYFAMLLGPLAAGEAKAQSAIKALEPQIAGAKQQIKKTEALKKQAPAASAILDDLKSRIPEGAPVAWFPPRMAEFFKQQGIDKCLTRLTSESAKKDLSGFREATWTIELPKVGFIPLGIAVAGLENEEPLLEITNVSIEASKEDVQFQHAILTVVTLVKQ